MYLNVVYACHGLALVVGCVPFIRVAANLHVSRQTIYDQTGGSKASTWHYTTLKSSNWSQEEDHGED